VALRSSCIQVISIYAGGIGERDHSFRYSCVKFLSCSYDAFPGGDLAEPRKTFIEGLFLQLSAGEKCDAGQEECHVKLFFSPADIPIHICG